MNKIAAALLVLVAAAIAGVGISFAVENNLMSDSSSEKGSLAEYVHTVKTGDFHSIDASMSVDVEYTRGALAPVKVVTGESVLPYVTVEVKRGVLELGMKKEYTQRRRKLFGKDAKVKIYVTAPNVNSFSASTSADITCKSALTGLDKLTVEASTSGNVKLGRVSANSVKLEATTSGDVKIEKLEVADRIYAGASTSGDVSVSSIAAKNLEIDAATSGDFSCNGLNCNKLVVSVNTNSDVDVEGTAVTLAVDAATGGDFNGGKLRVQDATATASTGGSATVNAVLCNSKSDSGGSVKNRYK